MGHATAREANYPEIGDDEHIVHLVVEGSSDFRVGEKMCTNVHKGPRDPEESSLF
jgi:hypothetical protein